MTRRISILCLLVAGGLCAATPDKLETIRGTLVLDGELAADPLRIRTDSGVLELSVKGDNMHALHDKLLAQRTWELEGALDADGRFEIIKMFTVVDGKRMKVTYYCEVCHITSYRPGRCMCCQDEVELKEIPAE